MFQNLATILLNLRRIALIAAISLSLARIHWIIGQIRALETFPSFRLIYVFQLAGNSLLLIPLPLLLVTLYRTRTPLAVPVNFKYLALATALVYGTFVTIPRTYLWISDVRRAVTNIGLFGGLTVADNLWSWFQVGDPGGVTVSALIVSSQLSFFLVLLALFYHTDGAQAVDDAGLQRLRRIAGFAAVAGGLAVLTNVGGQIYAVIRFTAVPDSAYFFDPLWKQHLILRNAVDGLPVLCLAMAPFIIYRSDSRVQSAIPPNN